LIIHDAIIAVIATYLQYHYYVQYDFLMNSSVYLYVLFFSLIGGVFSLLGGVLLLYKKVKSKNLSRVATPFAAGALLAAVFLDLLPEGIHESGPNSVLVAALVGVLGFFVFERSTHWFHHHHDEKDSRGKNVPLIIIGDTLHNALDGVAIAAGFLVSVPTGIVTTIAVAAHEIPQEIGDFALLLSRGVKPRQVLKINVLSSIATTVAALITLLVGSLESIPTGVLLGLSSGFLLYIAASDLIPTIHEHSKPKKQFIDRSILYLCLGLLIVGISGKIAHQYTSHEDHVENGLVHSVECVDDRAICEVDEH
jgi:zinc and cadmium transporter